VEELETERNPVAIVALAALVVAMVALGVGGAALWRTRDSATQVIADATTAPVDSTSTSETTTEPPTTTTFPLTDIMVAVPNTVGMNSYAAFEALADLKLNIEAAGAPSNDVPSGLIIAQDPGAGALVREGTIVNLLFSSGPES